MTETYAEVPSKYERREPKLAWLAMRIFYVIAICTYLAMCVNEAVVWGLYGGFVSIPAEQAVLFDRVMAMLSVAVAPIYVICAICTLFVLYRLVANAHAAGTEEKLSGPGMAVGSFFIPFVSIVMPPLVIGQLWRATFAGARKPNGIIAFWWTAFLAGNFIATFVGGMTGGMFSSAPPDLPDDPRGLLLLSAFGFLCRVAAASTLLVIFAMLVKGLPRDDTAEVFA